MSEHSQLSVSDLSLPEFKTVFDAEVYSIDFMASNYIDLSNPDPNILRRGFLVLERYRKPAVSEVEAYLQKTVEAHLSSDSSAIPDRDFSPLLANLRDQEIISLLKGDPEKVCALVSDDLMTVQRDNEQYLQAQYLTLSAPLYVQQGKKVEEAEWYHHAYTDLSLRENGMQRWFMIRLHHADLLEPEKVVTKIYQSSILGTEKEGAAYVMRNVCSTFSPPEHFARLKDGTSQKVREAALEYVVNLQKDGEKYASLLVSSKDDFTLR